MARSRWRPPSTGRLRCARRAHDRPACRARLARGFKGVAAGGGFSYGDVLGGGRGWACSILFNAKARKEFERFFARPDTFTLGACNGCQMMAALKELVPGAQHWPRFVRNRSEQFEGRLVMAEIVESPSLFFRGMAGSRIPAVTAHGEGKAEFSNSSDLQNAIVAMRYVDNRGGVAKTYPGNPSGTPEGITGLTTADGRFTIFMPHPERVFRNVQGTHGARGRPSSHRQSEAGSKRRRDAGVRCRRDTSGQCRALESHPRQQDVPNSEFAAEGQGDGNRPAGRLTRRLGARRQRDARRGASLAEVPDELTQALAGSRTNPTPRKVG